MFYVSILLMKAAALLQLQYMLVKYGILNKALTLMEVSCFRQLRS